MIVCAYLSPYVAFQVQQGYSAHNILIQSKPTNWIRFKLKRSTALLSAANALGCSINIDMAFTEILGNWSISKRITFQCELSALEEHDLARPSRRRFIQRREHHEPHRRDGEPENENHERYDGAGVARRDARARTCDGKAAHVEYS